MLDLRVLRQNGFKSLLSIPDGFQRMQTRKFSKVKDDEYLNWRDREYSEANPESDMEPPLPDDYDEFPHLSPPDAKVSDDPTLLKRADSLWKVGAKVSMVKGVENARVRSF